MRTPRTALRGIPTIALLASLMPAHAGVFDSPLPTFSDAKPAQRVAVLPVSVTNNDLDTTVVCTNLATTAVDVGLEVFDQTGTRGNTIAAGNGAILNVGPGATVTIATNNTAVLHEDALIALEPPVTSLRNGTARVVATSTQLGCTGFFVDAKHGIEDPSVCPTCATPTVLAVAFDAGAGATTTTTTASTTSSTSTTLPSLCAATPRAGCLKPTQPSKAQIILRDSSDDLKDVLAWKWTLGAATTLGDFGTPTTTTQYALCLYDYASNVPTLIAEAAVAPGGMCGAKACWRALSNVGFKYANKLALPDGLTKISLRVGVAGKAKIGVKGKGSRLPMPVLPLSVSPRMTVQLVNDANVCWDADYGSTLSNVSTLFKARSD